MDYTGRVISKPTMNATAKAIRPLQKALQFSRVLGGQEKVHSVSVGITALAIAMEASGFALDLVTGDMLLGEKGNRLLPFSIIFPGKEMVRVENRYISFSWENLTGDPFNRSIEITAYVS